MVDRSRTTRITRDSNALELSRGVEVLLTWPETHLDRHSTYIQPPFAVGPKFHAIEDFPKTPEPDRFSSFFNVKIINAAHAEPPNNQSPDSEKGQLML